MRPRIASPIEFRPDGLFWVGNYPFKTVEEANAFVQRMNGGK